MREITKRDGEAATATMAVARKRCSAGGDWQSDSERRRKSDVLVVVVVATAREKKGE